MIYLVGAVITLIVVVALSGPRVDMNISLNEIELPGNLDLYLSESESRFKDITEGTKSAKSTNDRPSNARSSSWL